MVEPYKDIDDYTTEDLLEIVTSAAHHLRLAGLGLGMKELPTIRLSHRDNGDRLLNLLDDINLASVGQVVFTGQRTTWTDTVKAEDGSLWKRARINDIDFLWPE